MNNNKSNGCGKECLVDGIYHVCCGDFPEDNPKKHKKFLCHECQAKNQELPVTICPLKNQDNHTYQSEPLTNGLGDDPHSGSNQEEICENCGKLESEHIDYFNTGKRNVCPERKSMKFKPKNQTHQLDGALKTEISLGSEETPLSSNGEKSQGDCTEGLDNPAYRICYNDGTTTGNIIPETQTLDYKEKEFYTPILKSKQKGFLTKDVKQFIEEIKSIPAICVLIKQKDGTKMNYIWSMFCSEFIDKKAGNL